jgi:hypothetical protein
LIEYKPVAPHFCPLYVEALLTRRFKLNWTYGVISFGLVGVVHPPVNDMIRSRSLFKLVWTSVLTFCGPAGVVQPPAIDMIRSRSRFRLSWMLVSLICGGADPKVIWAPKRIFMRSNSSAV